MSGVGRIFSLYRSILRAHRNLPGPMKELGGTYAREEFRTHLRSEKIQEKQWRTFVESWQSYVESLRGDAGIVVSGDLTEDVIEQLTPEQRQQLERLKDEAMRLKLELDASEFNQ